jgi:hypothetical protein
MALVKNVFIGFLIVVELINLAIGALFIFVGVKLYQQFSEVSDATMQGLRYTGIGTRSRRTRPLQLAGPGLSPQPVVALALGICARAWPMQASLCLVA